jgi:hypothetical protein
MLNSVASGNEEAFMRERLREYERATAQHWLVQQAQAGQPRRARHAASSALLRCGRMLVRAGTRLAEPRIA